MSNTELLNNEDGSHLGGGSAIITGSTISDNNCDGISMAGSPWAKIEGNKILDNSGWGIVVQPKKCGFGSDYFEGTMIPPTAEELMKVNEIKGNKKGEVCVP